MKTVSEIYVRKFINEKPYFGPAIVTKLLCFQKQSSVGSRRRALADSAPRNVVL